MIYDYGPDYEGTKKLAYETLIKYSDGQLPIDITSIIKQHDNIKIFTFEKFMKIMNFSYEEIIDKFASEHGFVIYDIKQEKYIIAYNEQDNTETQRWTLSHELGHILKGHLKNKDYNLIHYNNGDHPLEKEANTFAKHILAPFPLITKIQFENKKFNIVRPEELSLIFNINYLPAANICEHFDKLQFYPRHLELEKKFYNCIKNMKVGPLRCFTPIEDEDILTDFLLNI